MIALVDGFQVGAAWYRLFKASQPGFGFVDEQTPELAVAVVPSARGHGLGGALLDELLDRARADEHPAISLCVDKENSGAIHVYEEHGFQRVSEGVDSATMVASLRSAEEAT